MSDDFSCPNCESKSMIRKRYLAIPQMEKLKMDFCTPKCFGKKSIYGHVSEMRSPRPNGGQL
ncbi:uncharacterized protein [Drosophila suzukii]|uniref:Uncharacterized protein isoform X4 n=1 Tax=Drosophila suzukii TaxID=28584 RepID=A0ABM4TMY7_DROSZ